MPVRRPYRLNEKDVQQSFIRTSENSFQYLYKYGSIDGAQGAFVFTLILI